VIKLVPLFEKTFRKYKQPVGKSWRMDESVSRTQAKVCGAVLKMGVGLPSWLAGAASNRPVLLRSKGVVVSDRGKVIIRMAGTC